MGIDWFTFCAQIINFLILVWLLKKVLYQPVLNAMAEREAKIAARLNDAAEQAAQAEHEKGKFVDLQRQLKSSAAAEMQRA
ncbi:MAG: F0F1 ATP synthase subunit B, partial [Proteobacteria bacterium]|nr:F0F1 ATP synthase subunit B [Pseudomonadota bacterium]